MIALEAVASVQLGKMLSPASKTGRNPFPYLRNQNVQWNRLDLRDMATMDFTEAEQCKFELKPGDLLVCEGGDPGRCAIWNGEISNCFYQKALHRVRPQTDRLDVDFLRLWLWFQCQFGELSRNDSRTTIAHLPLNQLKRLLIPDIPVTEQQAVCKKLWPQMSRIGSVRDALSLQLDEVDALGTQIVVTSLKRSKQPPVPLGSVLAEIRRGIGQSWKNFPVFGASRAGLAPAKERPGKTPERYKPVDGGTVFYNPMRILIGSIAFVDHDDEPGITSPDYVVLKGKPGVLDSRWFYFWLRSPIGKRCIQLLARGAVRERMLFNRLSEGEIELPAFDVQLTTSEALAQIKPIRSAIQKQIEEIELIPQKLLANVFAS